MEEEKPILEEVVEDVLLRSGAASAEVVKVELPIPRPGVLVMRCGHLFFNGIDEEVASGFNELLSDWEHPDFVLVTAFQVRCEDPDLAAKIFCKPGATPEEIAAIRDELHRLREGSGEGGSVN